MRAAARASSKKRPMSSGASAWMNFTATGRARSVSWARYTRPVRPRPSDRWIRYSSNSGGGLQLAAASPMSPLERTALRLLQHRPDAVRHLFGQRRLGHVRVAPDLLRLLRVPRERVAGQRHHGNVGRVVVLLEPARRRPAVHQRKRHVHQDHVRPGLLGALQRLQAVGGDVDVEALVLEELLVHLARVFVVLDDQDLRLASLHRLRRVLPGAHRRSPSGCTGSCKVNVDPFPSSLFNVMPPPRSSASLREIDSPRPAPPYLRDSESSSCVKSSNTRACWSAAMPIPVSATAIDSRPERRSCCADSCTPPSWVNFTALPTRFTRICFTRWRSERISGSPAATWTETASPDLTNSGSIASTTSWSRGATPKRSRVSDRPFASSRLMSSR